MSSRPLRRHLTPGTVAVVIYLLRHAKAESHAPSGRDEDRSLTPEGERQAAYLARAIADSNPPLDRRPGIVLTSPAVRACATAGIIAWALGLEAQREPSLGLDARPRDVAHLAEKLLAGERPALIVGHNPTLEMVIAMLARDAPQQSLRTGELVVLGETDTAPRRIIARLRLDD